MYGTPRMVLPFRTGYIVSSSAKSRSGLYQGECAIASAAVSVSVGAPPLGGDAAVNKPSHALSETRVTQPASTSASVAKFAIVVVCPLFSGPWIASPQEPVWRSTRFDTLPAAIRKLSGCP